MSGAKPEIEPDLARGIRLEWWTLAWMSSIVAVMVFASGGSQAFRTALIEDVLSLIPAIVFLVATRFERRQPNPRFPYGFHRVQSLAFLIAAVTLSAVGAFLLYESILTLVMQEHPSLPPVKLFGEHIWSGWVMIAALTYSAIPPFILGRLKHPVATELHDKVLHTDALMQKADWMTGLAGIAGIIGIGFGLWWADAVAAGFISFSVLYDGLRSLRIATAELIDGAPRALDSGEIADDAKAVRRWLGKQFPGSRICMRESGRYICAEVKGVTPPKAIDPKAADIPGLDDQWRLETISFKPPDQPAPRTSTGAGRRGAE